MFLGVDLMNISDIKNSLIIEIEKLVEIIKKEYPNLVDIPIDYDLKKNCTYRRNRNDFLICKKQEFLFSFRCV